LDLVQRVAPVELEFTTTDCDAVDASLTLTGNDVRRLSEIASLGDGRFRALVPPEAFQLPYYCLNDVSQPQKSQASLDVTCLADGRHREAFIDVSYATAWRAVSTPAASDAVFAGPAPDSFFDFGSGYLTAVTAEGRQGAATASIAAGRDPVLATSKSGDVF